MSVSSFIGSNATFTCKGVNEMETGVTYQWYSSKNKLNNNDTSNINNNSDAILIPGQTSRELTLVNVRREMDGTEYKCIASVNTVKATATGMLSVSGKWTHVFFSICFIYVSSTYVDEVLSF